MTNDTILNRKPIAISTMWRLLAFLSWAGVGFCPRAAELSFLSQVGLVAIAVISYVFSGDEETWRTK